MDREVHRRATGRELRTAALEIARGSERGGAVRCLHHIGARDYIVDPAFLASPSAAAAGAVPSSNASPAAAAAATSAINVVSSPQPPPRRLRRRAKQLFGDAVVDDVRLIVIAPYQPWLYDAIAADLGRSALVVPLVPAATDVASASHFTTQYPSDEWEIIAYFVMNLADIAIVSTKASGTGLMHTSRKAYVVDPTASSQPFVDADGDHNADGAAEICAREAQCQPCFAWHTFDAQQCPPGTPRDAAVPLPPPHANCTHSLWYRW